MLYGPPRGRCAGCGHWQFGGEMLSHTDYQQASFALLPLGLEAGTPAIAAVIALGAAWPS